MLEIVLNVAAVSATAGRLGIVGEIALVEHLGMRLAPVTFALIAAVVSRLPISAAEAFSYQECRASVIVLAPASIPRWVPNTGYRARLWP